LSAILQIVPRVPGGIDGVGDYALTIARKLRNQFGCDTIFAAFEAASTQAVAGFEVWPLERLLEKPAHRFEHVLLHYVNYGFQKRGIPFRLLSILRSWRQQHRGKLVTVFHELYASGPPWTSAFWLQPLQMRLAKSVARASDVCIVSSENFRRELGRALAEAQIELHPVPSGFGEPLLSSQQIGDRNPHQWVIVGGTALVERSLRSFLRLFSAVPAGVAPRKLFVLGGNENPVTRSLIRDLPFERGYRPRIAAEEASEILCSCSFVWFDYFHRPEVETAIVLKSSAFASACAHAIIPVFPHRGSTVSVDGDQLPGPFFVERDRAEAPDLELRAKVATEIYHWYQRNASSDILVRRIAQLCELNAVQ
jgi:hypothetical protein